MNLLQPTLWLKGFPVRQASRMLDRILSMDEAEFADHKRALRRSILRHHWTANPLYRNLLQDPDVPWEDVPIMTKAEFQCPLADRLSAGFEMRSLYVSTTSGSSGNPFRFAKDKLCHSLDQEYIRRAFNEHGIHGKKQARFYGMPKDAGSRLQEQMKDRLLNRRRFDVSNIGDAALVNWLHEFAQTPYVFLNGYTTIIVAFARFLRNQDTVLKSLCPTLKCCVVTSEMCSADDRALMERWLGVPVVNEYGASEFGLIAFEDASGFWMVNTRLLQVEVLDHDGRPLPDGEEGDIVVTALYNRAHPFIRYNLGDVGAVEKIDGQHVRLLRLSGRNSDLAILPSGKIAGGMTMYYVVRAVMDDGENLKEIRVHQRSLDTFEIHYASRMALGTDGKHRIEAAFNEYLEPGLHIEYFRKEVLERLPSGKIKQFSSDLKPPV